MEFPSPDPSGVGNQVGLIESRLNCPEGFFPPYVSNARRIVLAGNVNLLSRRHGVLTSQIILGTDSDSRLRPSEDGIWQVVRVWQMVHPEVEVKYKVLLIKRLPIEEAVKIY